MKGLYIEKDIYEDDEWTAADVKALLSLGVKCKLLPYGKLKIVDDTSEQSHELCDVKREDVMMRRVHP